MTLLSLDPHAVISVEPLREDMAKAVCERVLQNNGVRITSWNFQEHWQQLQEKRKLERGMDPFRGGSRARRGVLLGGPAGGEKTRGSAVEKGEELQPDEEDEQAAAEVYDVNYWDWSAVWRAIGGHPTHLRLFVQELVR